MTRTGFPARLRVSHQRRRETDVRRRNGKLQSCETCRKGKLRCDHMMPACGRCTRQNKQCVYHPAPLTKTNSLPTPQTIETDAEYQPAADGVTVSIIPPFPPFDESSLQPRVPRANSASTSANSALYAEDFQHQVLPVSRNRGDNLHLLELNSFVAHDALLAENEITIGISNSESPIDLSIPQSQIEKGAAILSLLIDLPLFDKYIEKWFSFARGVIVIEPMVKAWSSGMWTTWHKVLESQTADGLRRMSENIWKNTMKPLAHLLNRDTTPREFIAETTGEHLRWEVVGIILTLVGLLAQNLQDGDPVFCSHDEAPVDRAALALKSYNASDVCLKFCSESDIMNDLVLWHMYEHTILACSLRAKGSYYNFQKSGQLYTALIASGLHQEIKVDDRTPFFIAEFRKRLFICAYENDKYTAAFVGRPPRLTRQYCRIQLPLDLNDAQTMSDGLNLESAMASLDPNGWNQSGTVQSCTYARIFASNALITEEILEISLGVLSNQEIVQRAGDIETRAIHLWENIPSFLKIDQQHPWDMKRAPVELLFLAHIRLADMGHHFLLQRTLIKKVGADSTKLLAVCREMFDFVLMLMNHRDFLRDFQMDIIQLYCMNGIPSAAVVAVELLHQERDPLSISALTNRLPRSDTIQDLSVLVAHLGNVRPESGGYAICSRGKKFLKKILDTILNPTPTSDIRSDSSAVAEGMSDPTLTTPLFQTGSDGEFVRWLESMEWEDNWVNFN